MGKKQLVIAGKAQILDSFGCNLEDIGPFVLKRTHNAMTAHQEMMCIIRRRIIDHHLPRGESVEKFKFGYVIYVYDEDKRFVGRQIGNSTPRWCKLGPNVTTDTMGGLMIESMAKVAFEGEKR